MPPHSVAIDNWAENQYLILVDQLEKREQIKVRNIYKAQSFNHLTQNKVYKDIGRVKWHFIRRVVHAWVETLPEERHEYYNFKYTHIHSCTKLMHGGQTFKITAKLRGTRCKTAFVYAVLCPSKNLQALQRHIPRLNNQNEIIPSKTSILYTGAPGNLHGIIFDGNCDSNLFCPV